MIKLIRLDERLIHGQIAIKWSKVTGVDRIIVANDAAAESSIIQKSLMMAAPREIKTVVKSMDDALKILQNPKAEPLKILVLVKNPDDMNRMIAEAPGIEKVNIGNFGRVEPENPGHKRVAYGSNLYVDDIELPKFMKIAECGIECVYQTTPEDPAQPLKSVLSK